MPSVNPRHYRDVWTLIVPLRNATYNELIHAHTSLMVHHLHFNNLAAVPTTVDLHMGDPTRPADETFFARFVIDPDCFSTPLFDFSLQSGQYLWAFSTTPGDANCVLNGSELGSNRREGNY